VTVAGPAPAAGAPLEAAALVAAELLGARLTAAVGDLTPLGAPEAWYQPAVGGGRLVLSALCPDEKADPTARANAARLVAESLEETVARLEAATATPPSIG
jgi:hypothetical protein